MKKTNGKFGSARGPVRSSSAKVFFSAACFALTVSGASADLLKWDPLHNGSGSVGNGTWSGANWATGVGNTSWTDGNNAEIGGSGVSVITLDQNVSGGTLTINNTGGNSSINGASFKLLFDVYNVTSGAGTPTVNADLNWANGFTLIGGGTLSVSKAYSGNIGNITLEKGTLRVGSASTFNGGSIAVNSGAMLSAIGNINSAVTLKSGAALISGTLANLTAESGIVTIRRAEQAGNILKISSLTRTAADIGNGRGGATVYFRVGANSPDFSIDSYNGAVLGSGVVGWAVMHDGQNLAYKTSSGAFDLLSSTNDPNFYLVGNGSNLLQSASATSDVLAQDFGAANTTISSDLVINSLTHKQALTVNANLKVNSGAILSRNATTVNNGTGTLTSGAETGELFLHTHATTTWNVKIVDNGATAVALVKDLGANLTLGANNTYTGGTFINEGGIILGVDNALAVGGGVFLADVGSVASDAGGKVTVAAVLNLNNKNQTIGALWGGGSKGGNILLGNGRLTVRGNADGSAVYRGAITGAGGVTKETTSIQTLAGANSYTGTTQVNAGKLFITGTSGATTVSAGATLGIGEQNAVGIFNTSAATFIGGNDATDSAGLAFALAGDSETGVAGVDFSQLVVTSVSGFLIDDSAGDRIYLTLSGVGAYGASFDTGVNHVWNDFIITGDGSGALWDEQIYIGSVTGLNGASAGSFSVSTNGNGNLNLYYTAVPEPASLVMLGAGAGLLLGLRRRTASARG